MVAYRCLYSYSLKPWSLRQKATATKDLAGFKRTETESFWYTRWNSCWLWQRLHCAKPFQCVGFWSLREWLMQQWQLVIAQGHIEQANVTPTTSFPLYHVPFPFGLCTHNNTDVNKLVIHFGILLYHCEHKVNDERDERLERVYLTMVKVKTYVVTAQKINEPHLPYK